MVSVAAVTVVVRIWGVAAVQSKSSIVQPSKEAVPVSHPYRADEDVGGRLQPTGLPRLQRNNRGQVGARAVSSYCQAAGIAAQMPCMLAHLRASHDCSHADVNLSESHSLTHSLAHLFTHSRAVTLTHTVYA
jgi:hypothetical protein